MKFTKIFKEILGLIFLFPLIAPFLYKVWFRPFGFSFNLLEVFVVISFLALAIFELFGEDSDTKKEKRFGWLVFLTGTGIFFVGALVSVFFSSDRMDALGRIKSWFLIPAIYGFLILKFARSKTRIEDLVASFGLGGILLSFLTVVGSVFIKNFWLEDRLRGFFESPNYISLYLVPVFSFFSTLFVLSKDKFFKPFSLAVLIFTFPAIVLSKSRLGIGITVLFGAISIAFLLAKIFLKQIKFGNKNLGKSQSAVLKTGLLTFSIAIVVGLFVSISLFNKERFKSSDSVRKLIWKESVEMVKGSPIKGYGLGDFQKEFEKRTEGRAGFKEFVIPNALHPHNTFLAVYLETSLIGLIGFVVILIGVMSSAGGILKNLQNQKKLLFLSEKNNKDQLENIIYFEAFIFAFLASIFSILIYGMLDAAIWKNDLALQFVFLVSSLMVISQNWLDFDV